jgi:ABC-type multidrug transport system ATPase subunit
VGEGKTAGFGGGTLEAVECRSVCQRYGSIYALFDVSIRVQKGKPCVVMGPNGCGKSTLLEVLAGLRSPTAGEVVYGEEKGDGDGGGGRRGGGVGLMGHRSMVYDSLSATENMVFFLRMCGSRRREAKRVGAEELLRVGFDPADDRPVGRLSHGMRRRVALARALAVGGDLLLLDEPGSGLDERGRKSIREVVRSAAVGSEEAGSAGVNGRVVVLTTHDCALAAQLGRHGQVVVLSEGRVAARLAGQEVSEQRVAECLGESRKEVREGVVP